MVADGRLELGKTEVQELGCASFRHEDVGRLDVAMDDAGPVGGVERVGDVGGDGEQVGDWQRTGAQPILQRLAFEPLHGDERRSGVLADLVDGADMRMVERRSRPRFAPKSFDRGRVGRHRRGQKLERDLASEPQILGQIDDTHPATAEQRLDSVVVDRVTAIHASSPSASHRPELHPHAIDLARATGAERGGTSFVGGASAGLKGATEGVEIISARAPWGIRERRRLD